MQSGKLKIIWEVYETVFSPLMSLNIITVLERRQDGWKKPQTLGLFLLLANSIKFE